MLTGPLNRQSWPIDLPESWLWANYQLVKKQYSKHINLTCFCKTQCTGYLRMADADGKMRITKKKLEKMRNKRRNADGKTNEERKTNTKYKNNLSLSSASQKRNCISRSGVQIPLESRVIFFYFFFSGFFTQMHKLRSQLRGSFFLWFHFRSSYMRG